MTTLETTRSTLEYYKKLYLTHIERLQELGSKLSREKDMVQLSRISNQIDRIVCELEATQARIFAYTETILLLKWEVEHE